MQPPKEQLERGKGEYYSDVFRYRFACQSIGYSGSVLDIACGTGFGTDLLARVCDRCIGVDISLEAIEYATAYYASPTVEFRQADVTKRLPFDSDYFDWIVSFETIEHICEHEAKPFLQELHRILKPGGTLIISTPNNSTSSRFKPENPYHLREYSPKEFCDLLGDSYKEYRMFGQKTTTSMAIEKNPIISKLFFSSFRECVPAFVRRLFGRLIKPKSDNDADMRIEEQNWWNSYVMIGVCIK